MLRICFFGTGTVIRMLVMYMLLHRTSSGQLAIEQVGVLILWRYVTGVRYGRM